MGFSEQQRLDMIKKVCDAIIEGATLKSACAAAGITDACFRNWRKENAKIEKVYRAAQNEYYQYRRELLKFKAYTSLEKAIEGYSIEDVEEEFEVRADADGNEIHKMTKRKVKKRHIQPNVSAVIFAMSNLDSDNFTRTDRDKDEKQVSGTVNQDERKRILDEKLKEIAERHPNIKSKNDE